MRLRPWIILAALALGRVAFGYQFQTIATLATDLIARFHLSYAQLGSLIGTYQLLGVFTAIPLGLLASRFGDLWILGTGLALMTAGACISALSDAPTGIAVGRAVAGVGAVAMIVLQGKVIAEWFTGPRFMIGISVSVCSFPIGMGLAQLLLPSLLGAFGLRAALASAAVPAGLAFLLFVTSHRTPRHGLLIPRRFTLPSARECMLLAIAGLAWMTYTAGYSAFASYLPASLSLRGETLFVIALVMTIATWGNVPATLLGGGLATRFGGYNVFLVGTLSLVVGMAGMALTGWPVAWSALVGVVGGIHPGVIMAVGTLSARPRNRAVGMGIFYTLYYLGGAISPALCGVAADAYGSPAGGLLAAATLSAIAIPLYMLHRLLGRHETMLVKP
jgi:MFS family permease